METNIFRAEQFTRAVDCRWWCVWEGAHGGRRFLYLRLLLISWQLKLIEKVLESKRLWEISRGILEDGEIMGRRDWEKSCVTCFGLVPLHLWWVSNSLGALSHVLNAGTNLVELGDQPKRWEWNVEIGRANESNRMPFGRHDSRGPVTVLVHFYIKWFVN